MRKPPPPSRRDFVARLSAWGLAGVSTLAVAPLAGCGFTLRGAEPMPFRSVALVGFTPRSSLERTLRTQLMQVARVEDQPARAEVIVQALGNARERAVVATTAAGQVREFQLRTHLKWRVSTPKGAVLIDVNDLLLTRDMSYNETDALAKEKEAEVLYGAMDEDIAQQIIRRLAKLKLN